jgi:hypothetical protein
VSDEFFDEEEDYDPVQAERNMIATMLELSRQMRQEQWRPGDERQWQLSASSTIFSGLIRNPDTGG